MYKFLSKVIDILIPISLIVLIILVLPILITAAYETWSRLLGF